MLGTLEKWRDAVVAEQDGENAKANPHNVKLSLLGFYLRAIETLEEDLRGDILIKVIELFNLTGLAYNKAVLEGRAGRY
jgi:hypothetical protein